MLVAVSSLHAQTDRPLTQDELLKQIETLAPAASSDPGRRTPARMGVPGSAPTGARPSSSMQPSLFGEGGSQPALPRPDKPAKAEKKSKGPTEIVALEATFDQKAHLAVFIGQVVVTDPEFNVVCDKLTAYLKHDDAAAGPDGAPRPKATPAPAASPSGKKGDKGGDKKGGGLEKAIAEADPGKIVTVTQEKVEADGTISHSIGHGRRAEYVAATGDITLIGRPDVQQGINTCVSTDDNTIMILNRDGHMRVTGAHKTVIKDQGDLTK
jgi:lipopolysaccharide export system protein LptA